MKNEFIPYEQALELKELGFKETCFTFFTEEGDLYESEGWGYTYGKNVLGNEVSAPLYQQVFKWFREKHGLYYHILPEFYTKGINFNWQIFWYLPKEEWTDFVISDGTGLYGDNNEYPTQEDAEIACLNELIKIVKNKNEQTN